MAGVSKNESQWREWHLGEGRFANKGPRSKPRPDFGFGGPGQKPIPKDWWMRLEKFLVRRDHKEVPVKPQPPAKPGQLSPHFHVREFDCHNGAKVPKAAERGLRRLCDVFLERMRAKFGGADVLSGYRPTAYNASIGGATDSQHIYNNSPDSVAADMRFAKGTPQQWANEARRISREVGYGGVGEYRPTGNRAGFVHVDNRPYRATWSG